MDRCLSAVDGSRPVAWRTTARLVDWRPVWGSALLITAGLLVVLPAPDGRIPAIRVVAVVLPLTTAFQAAFLLPPDGDAMLELLATYPFGLARTLAERFGVLLLMQGAVGLAGTAVCLATTGASLSGALLAWLPPTLFLSGLVSWVVQATRQGTMGGLFTVLLWVGFLIGGDAAVARWPWLLPLHLFLQPQHASPGAYLLNRAALTVAAIFFTGWALRLAGNSDRIL